jgi:hypothetical protein
MREFENAVRDLRDDCSNGRVMTCIQKQMNLLEALGKTMPWVSGTTLGAICNELLHLAEREAQGGDEAGSS